VIFAVGSDGFSADMPFERCPEGEQVEVSVDVDRDPGAREDDVGRTASVLEQGSV